MNKIEEQILEVFSKYDSEEQESKGRKGLPLGLIAQYIPSCSESEVLEGINRLLEEEKLRKNNISDTLGRDLYVLPKWGVNPPDFR